MGYNISDVGGEVTSNGADQWSGTLDLTLSNASTISGDFDRVYLTSGGGGFNVGDPSGGYTFSALSNPAFGTLRFGPTNGNWTFTADWDAIRATGSDQVVSFVVVGHQGTNADDDTVTINLLICVARGTWVETERGSVAVEDLRRGDRVCTMDGPAKPVRWIGSKKLSASELRADPDKYPIRFAPGALGENVPRRPLLVSPQHRMYLHDWRAELLFGEEQVLVPAKALVNDHSILRETGIDEVEYFHILFDSHEIIFTEGAATESFHPGHYAMSEFDEAVRDELFSLFPELRDGAPGYGQSARRILRPWEARLLAMEKPERPS
ncbi:MAG TPA: hypothetical protein DEA05_15085 [Rhodobacteraceae bacterium]|nr:hypothetical protein [Paracoccaceae bacterium]